MAGDDISKLLHHADDQRSEPHLVIEDRGLNFNLRCAVKYISRAGRKDNNIQDLEKARQFLTIEINRLKKKV